MKIKLVRSLVPEAQAKTAWPSGECAHFRLALRCVSRRRSRGVHGGTDRAEHDHVRGRGGGGADALTLLVQGLAEGARRRRMPSASTNASAVGAPSDGAALPGSVQPHPELSSLPAVASLDAGPPSGEPSGRLRPSTRRRSRFRAHADPARRTRRRGSPGRSLGSKAHGSSQARGASARRTRPYPSRGRS